MYRTFRARQISNIDFNLFSTCFFSIHQCSKSRLVTSVVQFFHIPESAKVTRTSYCSFCSSSEIFICSATADKYLQFRTKENLYARVFVFLETFMPFFTRIVPQNSSISENFRICLFSAEASFFCITEYPRRFS